jgi:hypothetical protein
MFLQKGLDRKIDEVSDLPGGQASPRGKSHAATVTQEREGARQIVLRTSSGIRHHGHCLLGREFAINNANAICMVTPILHPFALTEF